MRTALVCLLDDSPRFSYLYHHSILCALLVGKANNDEGATSNEQGMRATSTSASSSQSFSGPGKKKKKSEAQQLVSSLVHVMPVMQTMMTEMREARQKEEAARDRTQRQMDQLLQIMLANSTRSSNNGAGSSTD